MTCIMKIKAHDFLTLHDSFLSIDHFRLVYNRLHFMKIIIAKSRNVVRISLMVVHWHIEVSWPIYASMNWVIMMLPVQQQAFTLN